ncbi:hypothetical protein Ahy_A06g030422 [Arachis hypogaea]|uniref:Uncharacterized protein n=1 Tax=Arachis hypogaea TaxID=3818 RepID=A0A445CW60_ARAHY|nr:hypothetical protein Ahy_A06g030422 [Arachis hypogaea]
MTPSKGSLSPSNRHGGRLGGGHSCSGIGDDDIGNLSKVEISKEQHTKCLCELMKIRCDEQEKLSHCKFDAWVDKIFDIKLKNDDSVKNVAMSGGEIVANISPMYDTNNAGLEHKLMELQNRIDLLEIQKNVVSKAEGKSKCTNIVLVIMFFAALVLILSVTIAIFLIFTTTIGKISSTGSPRI